MKRVTDQLSKPVIAALEGVTAGIAINVFTDPKLARVRGYKVVGDESDEAALLPLRRVMGDADALVARNLAAPRPASYPECPLGAKVFDTAGAALGTLKDMIFDKQSGKVLSLVVEQTEVSPDRVLSFGKSTVVLRAPAHLQTQFKAPARKSASQRANKPAPAFSLDVHPAEEPPAEPADFPFQNYAFLLGRRVKKDILNGAVVVANQENVVTPEVILRAHENGKLVELTVNSRK